MKIGIFLFILYYFNGFPVLINDNYDNNNSSDNQTTKHLNDNYDNYDNNNSSSDNQTTKRQL